MIQYEISRNKHRSADFKDVNIEKNFLGGILHNKTAFIKIVDSFNSSVFTNVRLKNICDGIVMFYLNSGEFVTDENMLNTLSIDKTKLPLYKALFDKIHKLGEKRHSTGYLLTCKYNLEQLYSARVLEIGLRDTVQELMRAKDGNFEVVDNAGQIIKALSEMVDAKSVSSIKLDPVKNFKNWLAQFEAWQKEPDRFKGIPTGITQIDNVITGLRESEFGLLMASTGVGKSIFLMEAAINCWLKYGDIVYITIEMSKEQLENRFWCNLSKIEYENFRKLTLTKKQKRVIARVAKRYSKHPHKFNIIDMNEGCTIKDVVNKVRPYMTGSKVKLICIDYMNIVAGNDGKVDLSWETQVGISVDIKQKICRKFNIPVWSACQMTGDDVAFGRHIRDNIDIGVRLEETEDTEETGIVNTTYPKARDFRGRKHTLKTNRHIMKIS